MDNLHAVIDEGGDDSTNHPCPAKRSDNQQDDDGCSHACNVLDHGLFECLPWHVIEGHADEDAEGTGGEKSYLAAATKRIAAEGVDGGKQHSHQKEDGKQGG